MDSVRYEEWDEERAPKELQRRLESAKQARRHLEQQWTNNERAVFATTFTTGFFTDDTTYPVWASDTDESGRVPSLSVSYCMKNVRFLHSQMSANPPVGTPRPNSSDQEDKRAAKAADCALRYGRRQYKFPEKQDQVNLNTLVYGTGFGKTLYDPNAGMPIAFNQESGEAKFEGDFVHTIPHPRNMFLDPDATAPDDVNWAFELCYLRAEQLCAMFPTHTDKIKQLSEAQDQTRDSMSREGSGDDDFFKHHRFSRVPVFQYWERGTPENLLRGRFAWMLPDGTVLNEKGVPEASPYAFPVFDDATGEPIGAVAKLPYHILTDLDIPGTAWGQSVVSYAVQLQDLLNHLDNSAADIIQAHGVARLLVPQSSELADDAITNNTWDVTFYAGQIPPSYMEPLPFPQALPVLRAQVKQAIDDMFGLTDLNMGQQSRETSGNAMQYAVEQSNMVRKRLFNKLTAYVESVLTDYLALIATNWKTARTIKAVGRENAVEVIDLQGSDIAQGYDIQVEYGALSLDPLTRRMELTQMAPMLEKGGVSPRRILGLMRMGELTGALDEVQLAEARQLEYFEKIIATGKPATPGRKEDHANMLAYALIWRMTAEFRDLTPELQDLCLQHIEAREQMLIAEASAAPTAGGAPKAPAAPILPGALPGGPARPALDAALAQG